MLLQMHRFAVQVWPRPEIAYLQRFYFLHSPLLLLQLDLQSLYLLVLGLPTSTTRQLGQ